jgi:hypothetical protein
MPQAIDLQAGALAGLWSEAQRYDVPPSWQVRRWQDECLAGFRHRFQAAKGSFFSFIAAAGVGSGKTMMSAMVAAYLLNKRAIDRLVYVCPNVAIRDRVIEEFLKHNIHLVRWNKDRHGGGEPLGQNGVILTYQALSRDYKAHARLCGSGRTFVVFDEIHHLADKLSWGETAVEAFQDRAVCVLGLSGTPYRGDSRPIPFVNFEDAPVNGLRRFKADFQYTFGRSIVEGVCRKPVFHWMSGDVSMSMLDKSRRKVTFDDEFSEVPVAKDRVKLMNRRLGGAVRHGSSLRSEALFKAVEFSRQTGRKLIIFVGGDSYHKDSGGIKDATQLLPAELRSLGLRDDEFECVVSDDALARGKIARFGKSSAWVLVSVNMVSEGVDIPELSVALFLTSITARSTTIQRIGRVSRGGGESHIYICKDPRYQEIARDVENERLYEIELGKEVEAEVASGGAGGRERPSAESLAIGLNGKEDGVTVGGVFYSEAMRRKYLQILKENNWPEGQGAHIVLPLIAKGVFGPVDPQSAPQTIGGQP